MEILTQVSSIWIIRQNWSFITVKSILQHLVAAPQQKSNILCTISCYKKVCTLCHTFNQGASEK
jgi:hypothetical protein